MDAFEAAGLATRAAGDEGPYLEFLRRPSLSAGIYVIPAGGIDRQQPHSEDEVYCVLQGRGAITVADEEQQVGPGSVIFVAAGVEHRFHDVVETLNILVVFAPAEYSQAPRH
jgi:mannose-6-phosphate isomerase-like protein (cupin superfamily)